MSDKKTDILNDACATAMGATALASSPPAPSGITDTSRAAAATGMANLLACNLVRPGTIEAMEARGQEEVTAQTGRLPADGVVGKEEAWLALGFEVGEVDPEDPIWVQVVMPPGWKIQRTGHSMWSELVDDKGRKRAGLFYKAAFYDRHAHISFDRRFRIDSYGDECDREDGAKRAIVQDAESAEPAHVTEWVTPRDGESPYHAGEEACQLAGDWLEEHWPNWEDVTAYWD